MNDPSTVPDPGSKPRPNVCSACGGTHELQRADEAGDVAFCRNCRERAARDPQNPFVDVGVVD